MRNVQKDAARDAAEYAEALMSYGEGAGTRRKLITSAVAYKTERIPGYHEAFNAAYDKVDLTKTIKHAKRAGKTRDVGALTSKNVKAMTRGDIHHMSTPLIVGVVVLAVAHKTGYDKKAIAYTKRKAGDVKRWINRKTA